MPPRIKYTTVEDYIEAQPLHARTLLEQLRQTIAKAAPGAEEIISYNIPAFTLHGRLVWYAAFKNHIGFYPRASGIEAFTKELSKYKMAKGSVQFPMTEPLPLALITKMVKYRVKENIAEEKARAKNSHYYPSKISTINRANPHQAS